MNELDVVEKLLAAKADPYEPNEVLLFLIPISECKLTRLNLFAEGRNCLCFGV